MRTAGLMMNDVWADRVLRERGVEAFGYEDMQAEISVLVESVELKHRSKDENYRPYLHLSGELRTVTPSSGVLYDISEVVYSPGQGDRVDAYYEFDDDQLVDLSRKGYFRSAFAVPEQITGIEWELPAKVDLLVLAPTGTEADGGAPVVFTRVHEIGGLEIDLESSGYDVAEYFADHSASTVRQEQATVDERGLRARSDAINSLFAEDEFELDEAKAAEAAAPQPGPVESEAETDRIAAGLQRAEAAIAAEAEQYRAELESRSGTPENLYRERVAPSAGPEQDREEHAEPTSDDLDLGIEEMSVDEEPQTGPSFEERKRRAVERAADLDRDDDHEHGLGS